MNILLQTSNRTIIFLSVILLINSCSLRPTEPQVEPPPVQEQKTELDPEALQHFMDGQVYMNQGNYAMAVIELQDALIADPSISTIHVSLAECFFNLGKPERAFSHLQSAIKLDPRDTEAHEMLGQYYLVQKEYPKAREEFEFLSSQDSENVDYILALAEIARLSGKAEEAIDRYLAAYYMDTSNIRPLEQAAQLALQEKIPDKALKIFSELIQENPKNERYLQAFTDLAVMNRDFRSGIEGLKTLAGIQGNTPQILIQMALLYIQDDHPDSAKLTLESLVAADSTNKMGLHLLSSLNLEMEDYSASLDYAHRLIREYPDYPQGFIDVALVFLNQDQYDQVVAALEGVADQFKDDFTIQYLLGASYQQLKDLNQAENYLTRAVDINPDFRTAWHSLAIIYDTNQRWAESDHIYQQLIDSDSTDAQAFNNFAYSLAERNEKLERALELADKANRLSPDTPAYLDTMGWIYFKIGQYDQARNYIQSSVELDSTNAVVLEHLGDVYSKLNQRQKAQQYYREALRIGGDNPQLEAKLK
ncbi:MAG: tetratricopeptide repeat protein [Fidelibacterota bacterium]